ncbi:MAG: Mobile element protein [uncultured Thermomicrobiales bacterium]|uniref:Mobile element protein n=1 Tax=uncultured Thermomicrobiales bacterium TaxID=1645740 RepID=A0A6J4UCD2_9BACT|nr:MAG: Mobile element protein [uncultured Thermomicrobiales bacterium]
MPLFRRCRRWLSGLVTRVRQTLGTRLWARPTARHLAGTGMDLVRSRRQLLAENALLRQQLLVLRRSVKRPAMTPTDRAFLMLLAGRVRAWREALLIVRPDTLLRWHRAGFRSFWRHKSRPGPGRPPLPAETVALIRRIAADNPLWGAERIRGELGKLGLRVAKRTIQTYLRGKQAPRPRGQGWATFLRAHAAGIWACDFLPVTDLLFRPLFAFFIIELATRRVVHVSATRHPTDAWVAQQLREATPFEQRPRYLIRDNDSKFGATFARVAETSGIAILHTPYRAPRANAVCERFLGSVRRECLDHLQVLGERHLSRVLREYVVYFNRARPHQGLAQATPESSSDATGNREGPVRALPVLGGLHHDYRRAA